MPDYPTVREGEKSPLKLGINGLGRIGKLTVWHQVARGYFSGLVINLGREAGKGLEDIAGYIERDSTYGYLGQYLYGHKAGRVIENLNEEHGTFEVNGTPVIILRQDRNPKELPWKNLGVPLIVDTTGNFLDPTAPVDHKNGSIQGHLLAGAEKVIVSAPFKIKDKSLAMPGDAVTMVMGINDDQYEPIKHRIISAASCTTTCLAFMVKPLLDYFGADKILSASMVTVHAATGSQEVLDRLPDPKADDLRKNRSIMNNIILTSTGAAKALALVIPEMKRIGFISESVRIPTSTGSLIILVLNIQDESMEQPINRGTINQVYRKASETYMSKYLLFTERQNVSSDIIGTPCAAAIIEGTETHTRTAHICVDLSKIPGLSQGAFKEGASCVAEIPVTQAVVYGWYDNELGSYTNLMGDLTVKIAGGLR
ncbi:MAG: glyceraldehyde 3-phosphate dehydrogenase NAD-binding domain-containing protein [Thermodesulfobacteriota bacterium]|nr:glyceraldehyde 3-phosphate dehydrogenase NAD-binding domain-containing protein [Thermodesulfobacteriota bacterium]